MKPDLSITVANRQAVVAQIWEDLLTATIEDARVPMSKAEVAHFFMALHFLKRCPTEKQRES